MKIVIFGASGRTGQHLISQALERGHTVTAFARTPGKIQVRHERLQIKQGDVHDVNAVEQAVIGQDVVLCALGINKDEPVTALADGTKIIITAMRNHQIRRILNISATGFSGERADFFNRKNIILDIQQVSDQVIHRHEESTRSHRTKRTGVDCRTSVSTRRRSAQGRVSYHSGRHSEQRISD